MSLPADLAADLPPPRDDEPASLRRDIVDELADHLGCALDRERQRQAAMPGELAGAPDQRVLQRFGNPAQIARRLWWDAMSEKIMTQRILVAFIGILTLACCVAVGVAFRMVSQQQREMAKVVAAMAVDAQAKEEQRRELERMLTESRVVSEKLIVQAETGAKLAQQGLADARLAQQELISRLRQLEAKAAEPADWNPAELEVVLGTEDGPPAAGFEIRMTIQAEGAGIPPLQGTTGADGKVRFERARYGVYGLTCIAPWGERTMRTANLQPGETFRQKIVSPPTAPDSFAGPLELDLPEDLRDRPILFRFNLGGAYRQFGKDRWSLRGLSSSVRGGFSNNVAQLLLASSGVIHSDSRRPVSMIEPYLSLADDGKVLGVQVPGTDYIPGGAVQFYTPSELVESPETGNGAERGFGQSSTRLMSEIPDAVLPASSVKLKRSSDGSSLRLQVPDETLAALRSAFERVDAARTAGEKRISFGRQGRSEMTYLPPVLDDVKEDSERDRFGRN